MLPNILLLSLVSLASALSSPNASPSDAHALSTLASRGIDPLGPIPADATPLPNGGYSFSADSDTAHWVRAHNSPLSKRASSGLSITLWGLNNCGGPGAFFPNVEYGVSEVGGQDYYIGLEFKGRALLDNEQLDMSILLPAGQDKCAKYVTSLFGGSGAGCYAGLKAFSCMRLLN